MSGQRLSVPPEARKQNPKINPSAGPQSKSKPLRISLQVKEIRPVRQQRKEIAEKEIKKTPPWNRYALLQETVDQETVEPKKGEKQPENTAGHQKVKRSSVEKKSRENRNPITREDKN